MHSDRQAAAVGLVFIVRHSSLSESKIMEVTLSRMWGLLGPCFQAPQAGLSESMTAVSSGTSSRTRTWPRVTLINILLSSYSTFLSTSEIRTASLSPFSPYSLVILKSMTGAASPTIKVHNSLFLVFPKSI
jgi:hypothetical protein